MTHLRCSSCGQWFHTSSTRSFRPCTICGGDLEVVAEAAPGERRVLSVDPPPVVSAEPGSYPEGERSYRSLIEFGRARRRRIPSAERDFGLRWSDGTRLYRAAWVAETGEIYIVQLGPPEEGGGHVEVLAAETRLSQVRAALRGWRDAMQRERSLEWLRERAARLAGGPLAAPA